MADNITIRNASGTSVTCASDEVTRNSVSEQQQIVKMSLGADGSFDGLVSDTYPVPVKQVPTTEASYTNVATLAYTDTINATYQTLMSAPASPFRKIIFVSDLDLGVLVSFDGGTHQLWIPPGSSQRAQIEIDYAALGIKESSGCSIRTISGSCSSGSIYAMGVL